MLSAMARSPVRVGDEWLKVFPGGSGQLVQHASDGRGRVGPCGRCFTSLAAVYDPDAVAVRIERMVKARAARPELQGRRFRVWLESASRGSRGSPLGGTRASAVGSRESRSTCICHICCPFCRALVLGFGLAHRVPEALALVTIHNNSSPKP